MAQQVLLYGILLVGAALGVLGIAGKATLAYVHTRWNAQADAGIPIGRAAVETALRTAIAAGNDPSTVGAQTITQSACHPNHPQCGRTLVITVTPAGDTATAAAGHSTQTATNVNVGTGIAQTNRSYSIVSQVVRGTTVLVAHTASCTVRTYAGGNYADGVGCVDTEHAADATSEGDVSGSNGPLADLTATVAADDTRVHRTDQCKDGANWICQGSPVRPDPNSYSNIDWTNANAQTKAYGH